MGLAPRAGRQRVLEDVVAWVPAPDSPSGLGWAQSLGEGSLRVCHKRETLGAGGLWGTCPTSLYLHSHPQARPPSPLTWTRAGTSPLHLAVPVLTSGLALVHSCVSCCVLPSSLWFCLSSNQPWAPGHRAFAPASSSIWVVFLPSSGYCLPVLQVSTHASSSGALPGCPNQTQGLIPGSHRPQASSQHISEAGCVAMCIRLETISPTGLCSVRTGIGLRLLTVASPVYTVARGRVSAQ